jgi:oligoendopeptidase F
MKFTQIPYERPDIDALSKRMNALIQEFNDANEQKQFEAITEINKLRNHFETMFSFASIRYTQDTSNAQNQAEQDFFDNNEPAYTGMVTAFYRALAQSKYRTQLEAKFGRQLFSIAEMKLIWYSKIN